MARNGSEVSEDIQLEHKHSFTYVYPRPASSSFRAGLFPYMICGCGLSGLIVADDKWWVPAVEGTGPDEWATRS